MKNQVIQFFQELPTKPEAQFNKALDLYRNSQHASANTVRHLNVAGYSPTLLESLLYDLKKLHGITDAMIRSLNAQKAVVKDPFKPEEVKQMRVKKQIFEPITAKDSSEVFPSAPEEVKEVIKLRQAYPFLSEDNCPDELKILVADKQTAYEKYVAAHKALLVVLAEGENATPVEMTEEEIFELAKTAVENFEINQEIFAEMEHYKETGEILGEHPIFIKRNLQEGINAMTMADAAKRQSNLDNYIRRDGKALEKAKDDKSKAKLTKKIKNWKTELDLINAKLGAK